MGNNLGKQLMKLFFSAPLAEGMLVFEDNEYLGLVLKKDVEMSLVDGQFNLFENINCLKAAQLPSILFRSGPVPPNFRVPVIDKAGVLIRVISYDEFQSHFNFDEFIGNFRVQGALDNMDSAFAVTNHFKKVVYANKAAMELTGCDLIGRQIAHVLKSFEVVSVGPYMLLEKDDTTYHLIISHSESLNFSSFVYQFLRF